MIYKTLSLALGFATSLISAKDNNINFDLNDLDNNYPVLIFHGVSGTCEGGAEK